MRTTTQIEHEVFIYPQQPNMDARFFFRACIDAREVEIPEKARILFEEFTTKIEEVLNEVR